MFRGERARDDDTNGHVHDVAARDEFLEALEHGCSATFLGVRVDARYERDAQWRDSAGIRDNTNGVGVNGK